MQSALLYLKGCNVSKKCSPLGDCSDARERLRGELEYGSKRVIQPGVAHVLLRLQPSRQILKQVYGSV
jgi:hypothetical protein